MQFRTDISFLRAVSVVVVMLYHFQVPPFSGGFIGVDVFFVISGFLMTQITLKSFDQNTFSLREFYIKRIKRIVPAMHFMLYFVLLISLVFFFRADLKLNAKYVLLADFFCSNIYFWRYLNYFTSGDNILLHTWTLGVEWQFYLIYPLLLLLLRKVYLRNDKLFWQILASITVLSFVLMLMYFTKDNNFTFYMLPTRFWELSIGGLAFGLGRSSFTVDPAARKTLTYISLAVIIFCSVYVSESFVWPSYFTVLPVLATSIVLSFNISSVLFSSKIVKILGDISYSLYLWHWPWLILFKYFGFLEAKYIALLVILSVGSALVSYYFVERKKIFSDLRLIALSAILLAGVSSLIFINPESFRSLSIYQSKKFEIANYSADYIQRYQNEQFNPCGCYVSNNEPISTYNREACLKIDITKKNILLLGDSHMAQFSSSLRKHPEYNWMETSMGYVLPVGRKNGSDQRWELQQNVFENFVYKKNSKVDLVLISVHWLMRRSATINMSEEEVLTGVHKLISKLHDEKVNYLFIGQSEVYSLPFPKIIMLKNFNRVSDDFLSQEAAEMSEKLKRIVPAERYVEIYQHDNIVKENSAGDQVYMFDGNHYSSFGAEQVVNKLILPHIKTLFTMTDDLK